MNEIVERNRIKNQHKPYNPRTGEGCYGDRVQISIEDAPLPIMYLPIEMFEVPIIRKFQELGSIKALYESEGIELTDEEFGRFWIQFCELRIVYDYEFYAITYQTIKDKKTSLDIQFKLNRGQRRVLERLEYMRKKKQPIYLILLKARQWGGSTLIQMYMNWIQMVHQKNWNSVVCAHVKDASETVRSMYGNSIKNMPILNGKIVELKNFGNTQNIKYVTNRGCRLTIGTAESPESVRSQDVKMAHFSEIGLYPNTEKMLTENLIASISSSIPTNVPNTLIAYESTAQGIGDFFHTQWNKAVAGESLFSPVFVEWFLLDQLYSEEFDGTFHLHTGREKVDGSVEQFAETLDEYELMLFNTTECTLENINWYRGKRKSSASEMTLKQEFPSFPDEAFQGSGQPKYRVEDIEKFRADCKPPIAIGDLVSKSNIYAARLDVKLQRGVLEDIEFVEDAALLSEIRLANDPTSILKKETNHLKIWEFPDTTQRVANRYIVILDPSKGKSEKADNAVVLVLDRYWKIYGGKTEVVAELVIKEDKDIVVYKATQIAKWYNNALFVPESNTIESSDRYNEGEFIFDIIADLYDNLYCRTSAEDIRQGIPPKWGFHTNKSTKPMIADNYTAYLREQAYIERSAEALNEARLYEVKKTGEMGAKQGSHDDRLMTRMIGLYIDTELPTPVILEEKSRSYAKKVINESSF